MDYKTAIRQTVAARSKRVSDAKMLYLRLLKESPELYEVEKQLRGMIIDEANEVKINLSRKAQLEKRRMEILRGLGITEEMLNPPFVCPLCGDTGLVDKRPCKCVIDKCVDGGMNGEYKFEAADMNIFPEGERDRIKKVYSFAQKYCEKFPSVNKLNLLFFGRCGSGKTFIASCIGDELSMRGYSVIMLSAFAFVNRMHKYHTTFDETRASFLDPLLDCDLLIIDDLGTENIMKNVTVEYFFHVLNERMTAKKHTVITTNLDDEMIRARYGERVYSRLFGSETIGFALSDVDLRARKKNI